MANRKSELIAALSSIVGDHLTVDPGLVIDGLTPLAIVRPGSAEEVAESLRACASLGAAVVPAGLMSWLESGNPLSRAEVVLSLERMSRIIEYSPPDLTVTVEAGLALAELNAAARAENQWLPLDPPDFGKASLGAVAACGASGPLRSGFGTPRDYVIGLRLAHIDGTESRSGGRVVKNVAGYDMNKLYVGSFGTLAVITELTFKLRPLPQRSATMLVTMKDRQLLAQLGGRILASTAAPASLFLVKGAPAGLLSAHKTDEALLVRFLENEAAVAYQIDLIESLLPDTARATTLDEAEAERVWQQLADIDQAGEVAVRVSVPIAAAAAVFTSLLSYRADSVATADLGAGIIRMAFSTGDEFAIRLIQSLRTEAALAGGSLFIERASSHVRAQAGAWDDVGNLSALTRSIKRAFDPQSLLNPGRFVAGI